jgi:hypothetical protein
LAEVVWLSSAPVKAMALSLPTSVQVGPAGILGDRRYAVIDPNNRLVNGKRIGPLATIVPAAAAPDADEADGEPERLSLRFPDGSVVAEAVDLGRPITAVFHGTDRAVLEVGGSFSSALSAWAGSHLRLVRLVVEGGGIDRAPEGGGFSIISHGSLAALAAAASLDDPLDPRRFRMSAVVDGVEAYAEDGWIGRQVQLGEVIVEPLGNVGRCAITTQDPDTGRRSLDTLELIATTRGHLPTTEALPFGVWSSVITPGTIRIGDPVTVLPEAGRGA